MKIFLLILGVQRYQTFHVLNLSDFVIFALLFRVNWRSNILTKPSGELDIALRLCLKHTQEAVKFFQPI